MQQPFHVFLANFGGYLNLARRRLGYSLRDLEKTSGVSDAQIRRLEAGDFNCGIDTFLRLCSSLGLPFGEVMERIACPNNDVLRAKLLQDPIAKRLLAEANITDDHDRGIGLYLLAELAGLLILVAFSAAPIRRLREAYFPDSEIKRLLDPMVRTVTVNTKADARLRLINDLQQACLPTLLGLGCLSEADLVAMLKRFKGKRQFRLNLGTGEFPPAWSPDSPHESGMRSVFDGWRERQNTKSDLDTFQLIEDSSGVPITWKTLKARLKVAAGRPGAKADMAREVKVHQSSVNSWLDEHREPGAEAAFRLLEWVKKDEAKQKRRDGAQTPPGRMTPKGNNDEVPKPGPRKRSHTRRRNAT